MPFHMPTVAPADAMYMTARSNASNLKLDVSPIYNISFQRGHIIQLVLPPSAFPRIVSHFDSGTDRPRGPATWEDL